jgi:hypothetical protein
LSYCVLGIICCTCCLLQRTQDGGGILAAGVSLTVKNGTFGSNTAVGYGGGISCAGCGALRVANVAASANQAGNAGGWLHSQGSAHTLVENSSAVGNIAACGGGAALFSSTVLSRFSNVRFSDNKAAPSSNNDGGSSDQPCTDGGHGGALCIAADTSSVELGITASGNSAVQGGEAHVGVFKLLGNAEGANAVLVMYLAHKYVQAVFSKYVVCVARHVQVPFTLRPCVTPFTTVHWSYTPPTQSQTTAQRMQAERSTFGSAMFC